MCVLYRVSAIEIKIGYVTSVFEYVSILLSYSIIAWLNYYYYYDKAKEVVLKATMHVFHMRGPGSLMGISLFNELH